ncbi:MAG: preprotein translocase subunit SecE [Oscillospiraceae bacterium]
MAKTKKKFFARIGDWFRGMKSELKKVVWPSTKQTTNNSIVVLAVIFASAIVLWGFDSLASAFVEVLINLFG